MKVLVVNRKTNKHDSLKIEKHSAETIKDLARHIVVCGPQYSISVVAESASEIDFIANSFCNIPVPAAPAKRGIWTGEMAIFILTNYPKDIPE